MVKGIVCGGLALLVTVSTAQAAILYWDGCTPAGVVSQNAVQGDGKWTAWSVYPDGWSASTAVSSVRNSAAPHNVTKAAYNTTVGQAAFAEIEFYLTAPGYWTVAATQSAASLGVGAIGVAHLSGATGLPATTSAFSTGNVWNDIGTMHATATNPKIKLSENGVTTNRWYLDQIRLTSATPGAATGGALIGDDVSWSAGQFTSLFDIYLDTDANPATKVGADLTAATTSFDVAGLGLQDNTTYYWKVVAKNVDMSAASEVWSFTTVPEPATMAFLGLGGLLLRRRRA